ncbi:tetraacyldisaccharide 4'-kinase [Campylobacter canadensis]|uniref:Tetraacyldisaccharide 4'-kinase n=1 Tax=Campylobacter canadensis TaxID=449520 RepID=A0ABS7WPP2_9BACT|nr:tetraacyldisaccharide 4'-kinase [Campylobacter canadensis]MBZ7986733.1 tetraacyldisaccharide 4'-kinase [Campylobacter canadensis]MBZ7994578.1 tetraacyldisaccharide 4'-kinase [Campylobacter canadensis]MBZ7996862.1 tetraacyldisaccharide 4'-kinase [Campylobacter canadensis]MBZ7997770.1 tetraacyldisaccharide 4'-kinase [Campylobacter canadensis]MBZ7999909.1 tetraacyldisaccharide 4'-kinase [Campylobacter canadensis]
MSFLDRYFFKPSFFQKILIFMLLPFSFLYMILSILNSSLKKRISFDIAIISVGNLSVGGSGKTPFTKALSDFLYPIYKDDIFIILRGYKRKSKGVLLVKYKKEILASYLQSSDEALEHAYFTKANVIVANKREDAIKKAISLGAKCVILDDAFSKFHIKKFDILLNAKERAKYNFTLPSGQYRLPLYFQKRANLNLYENKDYFRTSFVKEDDFSDYVFISAIAKPFRLEKYAKKAKAYYYFSDHYYFSKSKLEDLLAKHKAKGFVLCKKDYVKIKEFNFNTILIDEKLELSLNVKKEILKYIKSFYKCKIT